MSYNEFMADPSNKLTCPKYWSQCTRDVNYRVQTQKILKLENLRAFSRAILR